MKQHCDTIGRSVHVVNLGEQGGWRKGPRLHPGRVAGAPPARPAAVHRPSQTQPRSSSSTRCLLTCGT